MSYKTILVHVDESRHVANRIKIAAQLALSENAHLIGAAMTGVTRFLYEAGTVEQQDPNLAVHLEFLRARAMRSLDGFDAQATSLGVTSFERRLIDDDAGGGLSLAARYCDLVVIGQNDPDESSPVIMSDLPEYVVMNAGRPVLIVPYAGRFERVGSRVLVAWDASVAATRAVTCAIPLLKRAELVQVAAFNPESLPDVHGKQPGADIALYLARHGIKVEVTQQKTEIDVGNALLSLATDVSSDLIVMGGYVHSRFREIVMGGVTRTILESMTVPVLMSH